MGPQVMTPPEVRAVATQRIISADSHLIIKDEVLFKRLPQKHHAGVRAIIEGHRNLRKNSALYSVKKWPAADRAGEWDPVERLKDMDIDQVDAEIIYTEVSAGASFFPLKDGGRLAAFEAFNNGALEFASADPERLFPVFIVPVVEVEEAVSELQRLAKAGAKAVITPLNPTDLGLKPYWDRQWDPLWATIQETGIPVSQHLGGVKHGQEFMSYDPTPNKGMFRALSAIWMADGFTAWCMSGILERFPKLKVVMVEPGLGWIPYMLERMDGTVRRIGWTKETLPQLPSFYWRRNMAATFEEDEFGIENRHALGVENILWATDYPHPDSTWPNSQKVIRHHFENVPAEEMRKIVGGNAMRLYNVN